MTVDSVKNNVFHVALIVIFLLVYEYKCKKNSNIHKAVKTSFLFAWQVS